MVTVAKKSSLLAGRTLRRRLREGQPLVGVERRKKDNKHAVEERQR